MTVVTRFAPSPTGALHIGSVRTALFSWLYARHHGGRFILRIEDTDQARSTRDSAEAIVDGMSWLGLDHDEGPIHQMDRLSRYAEVASQLLEAGRAYRCYCSREELEAMRAEQQRRGELPRYDGRCRNRADVPEGIEPVIRFKNPREGEVRVPDLIHGEIVFDNRQLDDLVIVRSDGHPTYHFAVVVDDADMAVTHVIRGDDHLNNTPRQINLLVALDSTVPAYAHLPMIHGPDGAKLSKRHGAVDVLDYRRDGFLPEAMLNYVARLGWAHGDREIFSMGDLIELFDLAGVSASPARFDTEKLRWVNQQHMMHRPPESLGELLGAQLGAVGADPHAGPPLAWTVEALRERAQTLREMAESAWPYYAELREYEAGAARKFLNEAAVGPLTALEETLRALPDWSEEALELAVKELAARLELKLGAVAQPLRVALVGRAASPGIGVTLRLVGR
ncbi:MAG TPA: glutamate--tRNA ligase, partial [Gammaproteobacteria bacterium]|nr:glutamate--tRNA ligase [Gammaproteobacteria bacterium]